MMCSGMTFLCLKAVLSICLKFIMHIKDEEFVVLTFNFEGLEGETGLYQKLNWNFWDYSGIKVVNIVVDHPLYYHKYLAGRPKNYVQIDIDKVHMEYMNQVLSGC